MHDNPISHSHKNLKTALHTEMDEEMEQLSLDLPMVMKKD
jgi:hypothetical protein